MSSGFLSQVPDYLRKAQVYSAEIKEQLYDSLVTEKYVRLLNDFPDGDTFNIPSVGSFTAANYSEDDGIRFQSLDTGNFTFTIDKYIQVGTYFTDKMKQDSYLYNQVNAMVAPKFLQAIKEHWEDTVLGLQSTQTASALNNINGYAHRFVASGTNAAMTINDFQRMRLSFDKANVPMEGRVAICDPTIEYSLGKNPSLLDPHPAWAKTLPDGLSNGMRFYTHLAGFDIYLSNRLATVTSETINSVSVSAGAANTFFSVNPLSQSFIGGWRQMPSVEGFRNTQMKRDEYSMTGRYGVKIYRPEAYGVVLSTTTFANL